MVTPAFVRNGEAVRMQVHPEELALLEQVRAELAETLHARYGAQDDPVIGRLFPPAVRGDDETDGEVRGLIHDDLARSRLEALDQVQGVLAGARKLRGLLVVDLVEEQPYVLLTVLNDLRLALGAAVGIETVEDRDRELTDAEQRSLMFMDWFGMWQEQLLAVIAPESANHYDLGHDPDSRD